MILNLYSDFLGGKGLIIAIVIVISSLSFSLGFFAGKTTLEPGSDYTDTGSVKDGYEVIKENNIDTENVENTALDSQDTFDKTGINKSLIIEEFEKTSTNLKSPASKRAKVPGEKWLLNTSVSQKTRYDTSNRKYIVQLGAFKSILSAKKLRASLKQKGFYSAIDRVKTNDNEVLYKVRLLGLNTKNEATTILSKLGKKGVKGIIVEIK